MWALAELVEAAACAGDTGLARDALARLSATTRPAGSSLALGVEARSRALLAAGEEADAGYREAVERLSWTRLRPEVARAHLVYGEWLCREDRLPEARERLRMADELFTGIGMEAFADRARRGLAAAGAKPRGSRAGASPTRDELTPQEQQIARLARDGLTNAEIGGELFLSPRTVEWHLHKVFTKLGVDSRAGLGAALAEPSHRG
jgi:DNA-binding CsgD family transcriptional regulator